MNLSYILYTVLLILVWVLLLTGFIIKRNTKFIRGYLWVSVPCISLLLLYFWNTSLNNYVRSYLFAAHTYTCEYYDSLKPHSLPLPKRSVLKGKSDACSPFYLTFSKDKDVISFYETVLIEWKNKKLISGFHYAERDHQYGGKEKGYVASIPDGATLDIFIHVLQDSYEGQMLSIRFKRSG
ncbi:hypothetical protein [Paenibacillus agilis]|uniref:Uncharacterized protein n=1 Tax=Paenibacillus agilis TaxID=3020863 RepID=A0A559IXR7_9BACL|nr:hypothetical protein [Paenibacillus agilis]TVX92429.1 hypothetical protein FPZ44_04765 [Paenibacillus agilis]